MHPPSGVFDVARFEIGVEFSERVERGNRGEEVATEPTDITLDSALLMRAGDTWFAEERFEPVMGT